MYITQHSFMDKHLGTNNDDNNDNNNAKSTPWITNFQARPI